jgi:predicted outer membrane protein
MTKFQTFGVAAFALSFATQAAAATVSGADKKFVAMVSQGGMFEVMAGKLAAQQGAAQDIRDQAALLFPTR